MKDSSLVAFVPHLSTAGECNMRSIMKALRGSLPLLSGLYRAHSIMNSVRVAVRQGFQ